MVRYASRLRIRGNKINMKISRYELKQYYYLINNRFGTKKFTSYDVSDIVIGESIQRIGMVLRMMWYDGYLNKHEKLNKNRAIQYSIRGMS